MVHHREAEHNWTKALSTLFRIHVLTNSRVALIDTGKNVGHAHLEITANFDLLESQKRTSLYILNTKIQKQY